MSAPQLLGEVSRLDRQRAPQMSYDFLAICPTVQSATNRAKALSLFANLAERLDWQANFTPPRCHMALAVPMSWFDAKYRMGPCCVVTPKK